MSNTNDFELEDRARDQFPNSGLEDLGSPDTSSEATLRNASAISPPDTGKEAWLILAGCSIIQAPVWGFSLAFGVIQEYLSTHHEYDGDVSAIASIGTSATGIMYLTSPLTFWMLTRWPRLRRWCGPLGLALAIVGFIGSSFTTEIWHLIVLQGVICSLGSGLLFTPTTLYLDEWFIKRKGLAYGIMWACKSLTGAVIPFIVSAALNRFGYRIVTRAWAVVLLLTCAPLLPFMKPRIPVPAASRPRPLSWSFLKSPTFWSLQSGNIMQSLGYFLPTTYLSSYAVRMGLSNVDGTLLIAVLNGTSVVGSLILGPLVDKLRISTVIAICAVGSVASVLLCWGLATEIGLLSVFAISYGFFAGAYSTAWGGMLSEIKKEDETIETGLLFGLIAGGRGIGNVISGPLSSALLQTSWAKSGVTGGYGTEYGPIIVFTGATALLGGWGYTQRWLKPRVS